MQTRGSDPDALDFHLIVNSVHGKSEMGFIAAVAHAPVERWGAPFHWLGDSKQLQDELRKIGMDVQVDPRGNLNARWRSRQLALVPEDVVDETRLRKLQDQAIRETRHRLFQFLIPLDSAIFGLLASSCERAAREGKTLRIRLELPPELSNLPWELMRCPPAHSKSAVVLQPRISLIRYLCEIESAIDVAPDTGPGIVLLIRAEPREVRKDDLTQSFNTEWVRLNEVFRRHAAQLRCELIDGPDTYRQLVDRVNRFHQRIVGIHFIGHGDCDEYGGYLLGEDAVGSERELYWDELRFALDRASGLRWIFLNACTTGHTPAGCPLSGLATSLSVLKNVPTVIAYTRPVETNEAEVIAPDFYSMMLDERCGLDVAVRQFMLRQSADFSGLVVLARLVAGKMQTEISGARTPEPQPSATQSGREPSSTAQGEPAAKQQGQAREPTAPSGGTGLASSTRNEAGDQRASTTVPAAPMVLVPAGPFRRGLTVSQVNRVIDQFKAHGLPIELNSAEETLRQEPLEEVRLEAFEIEETPVTNAQFRAFVDATGWVTEAQRRKLPQTWRSFQDLHDHPVVLVSYDDALEYCKWAGRRLPSADEWKKACRGAQGRIYPWGDDFDTTKCNTAESQSGWETTPVRMFPQGRSPYGCYDMVGNVEEWTSSKLDEDRRIVLGGSWCMTCQVYGLPVLHRVASRSFFSNELGFRCVRDLGMASPADGNP